MTARVTPTATGLCAATRGGGAAAAIGAHVARMADAARAESARGTQPLFFILAQYRDDRSGVLWMRSGADALAYLA